MKSLFKQGNSLGIISAIKTRCITNRSIEGNGWDHRESRNPLGYYQLVFSNTKNLLYKLSKWTTS